MIKIYYIGGSPCCGKSTIAEKLALKYDLYYFKVDDFLEKYTELGAKAGYEICSKQMNMSPDEIWMRDTKLQCDEELRFYREIYDFVKNDINELDCTKDIIAEGVVFLPEIMKREGIDRLQYICITPNKEFQVEHYSKREWIPFALEGCSNKEQAFMNWMERDALFANEVREQCQRLGYASLTINGSQSVDEVFEIVCEHFRLEV